MRDVNNAYNRNDGQKKGQGDKPHPNRESIQKRPWLKPTYSDTSPGPRPTPENIIDAFHTRNKQLIMDLTALAQNGIRNPTVEDIFSTQEQQASPFTSHEIDTARRAGVDLKSLLQQNKVTIYMNPKQPEFNYPMLTRVDLKVKELLSEPGSSQRIYETTFSQVYNTLSLTEQQAYDRQLYAYQLQEQSREEARHTEIMDTIIAPSQEHFHQPSQFLGSSGDASQPPIFPPQYQGQLLSYQYLRQNSGLDANLSPPHFQESSSSGFDPETTTSLRSWDKSQGNYPPSTIWSDISQHTDTYPSYSYGSESLSLPEQPYPSGGQDHTHENTSSVYNQEFQSRYPVISIDENNQPLVVDYPVAEGDPTLPFAFIDNHNPIYPLYFTDNPYDFRYNTERYRLLSRTEGPVQLCSIEYAITRNMQQRHQRSQISRIASSTSEENQRSQLENKSAIKRKGKTRFQLENESAIRRTGRTRFQLENESAIRRTGRTRSQLYSESSIRRKGKTKSQLEKESSIRRTGKTRSEIKGLAKKLKSSEKTVTNTLTFFKQLEQNITQQKEQQKSLSNFTESHDGTTSINGRQARLHNVPGRGMNCLLYAMLAANGHDIHTPATHQIVDSTRAFLQTIGRAQENDLLEMDTATSQGAEALAYLRSTEHMNSNQGITIHATWQNPQDHQTSIIRQDVIPSQNGASSIELYLDLHKHHYNYIEYLD